MIIIKENLKANFKPLKTVRKDLTALTLANDTQQRNVSSPEMIYKLDKQGQENFSEIVLNLLLQIRNLNYNQSFLINNSSSLKQELIKQLKNQLTTMNWHKIEHTEEINVLHKNINNNNFFFDNSNLNTIIEKISGGKKN